MSEWIGLIPAAGRGVRAYPYTASIPKSMLEVDGVPNLQRNVELMRDQLGIRQIRIVVGHHGDVIRNHFGDGQQYGVAIRYVVNPRIDLELPYSIHLGGQGITSRCVMLLGDECYIGSNHDELRSAQDPEALVVCGVVTAEYARQIRKNYIVTIDDGRIIDLVEKPRSVTGSLMGTGTYLLHPDVFVRLAESYRDGADAGPKDWTSWLATLARGGACIVPFHLTGKYVNINSQGDLHQANVLIRNRDFEQNKVSLVYVIDHEEEAAAKPVVRFSEVPELDEVVAVARHNAPALDQTAGGKVRVVIAPSTTTPIGDLVRLGLDSATGRILLLSYSDDTFAPHDVSKLLVYLRDADMVVGTRTTRQMIEQGTNMRGTVRWAHILLAKLMQLLWWRFDSRFTDICCVYRGLWRSTYETVRDNTSAKGVEVFPEMVIEVLRARRRIIEIPVNYYNRDLEYDYVRSRYQNAATLGRILWLLLRKRVADSRLALWARTGRGTHA